MHIHHLKQWHHSHRFNVEDGRGERNTRRVILLKEKHHHSHGRESSHYHPDHNLRAAYLHVIADAMTSVPAIVALLAAYEEIVHVAVEVISFEDEPHLIQSETTN